MRIAPFLTMCWALLFAAPGLAAVERLEIIDRQPFADGAVFGAVGAYEKIRGRLHYAVDPEHPMNRVVVDIGLAPRDADGRVRFSGDVLMLRPVDPAAGNRRLLYEVGNRGGVAMLSFFNYAARGNDPADRRHVGDGFLFRHGYTLLWSGWNWDVIAGDGRLQIDLPIATDQGRPITGPVTAEITVNQTSDCEPIAWGNSRGYWPADEALADATLTVRDHQTAPREVMARERWRAPCTPGDTSRPLTISVDGGFAPGRLYELIFTARDPVVVGLGLTAIRDTLAFFRGAAADSAGNPNPVAGQIDAVTIFGISQSGRVIQHMLYQGFHLNPTPDTNFASVFDAALIHVAGGGKGGFNHRFAQTTRHQSTHEDHQYPADFFPFTTRPQTDPVTGDRGDVLAVAKAAGAVPKIFYTNTSTEYWTRSASLLHTDVDGKSDIGLADDARLYVINGAQHGNWIFRDRYIYEACNNPLDHRPFMRALLLRLDAWQTDGREPPANRHPRIDGETLGTISAWRSRFPEIPNLRLPAANLMPPRLDLGPRWATHGIVDRAPPGFRPPFQTRVPLADIDGNDLGGVRPPALAAPLGTYLGWNLRRPAFGAPDMIGRWSGTFVPFAPTRDARAATGDPRRSIAERYPSKAAYLDAFEAAARSLANDGFLLVEDIPFMVDRAATFYDQVVSRDPGADSCGYLRPH